MIAKRIRHTGIVVKDMAETEKFYRKMGFVMVKHSVEEWDKNWLQISKLALPVNGGVIELIRGNWKPHISLEIDEFPFGFDIKCKEKDGITIGFIQDPDGNWIELVRGFK